MRKINAIFGVEIRIDKKSVGRLQILKNRKYPETREEGYKVLCESASKILDELRYMIGCIYFLKAPMLRPNPKKHWFTVLLKMENILSDVLMMLGIHPSQQKGESDDSIPF